jgi:catechol 2,3-dioxygenase-like lactoylglutathione lyase family enzyme
MGGGLDRAARVRHDGVMSSTVSRRANAVGFVVADMAATIAFYRRCGLPIPVESGPDNPHVEVEVEGGFRLMFDTEDVARTLDPSWTRPTGGARAAIAIECDSPLAVDGVHADLVAVGHTSHLDPFDAPWGQRYASVLDPDGTPVDFYAPLD